MVRAVEAAGATAVARVENVEASHILQYVDRGIQGIMGPHIASGEDAEKLVDACYFGPIGHRSFGGNRGTNYSFTPDAWGDKRDFYQQANDNMIVGALLEDQGSIDNIDDILAVDGIHYFGIGMNDFAQGIGYPGEPEHPGRCQVRQTSCRTYIQQQGTLHERRHHGLGLDPRSAARQRAAVHGRQRVVMVRSHAFPMSMIDETLIRRLRDIVGEEYVIWGSDDLLLYEYDGSIDRSSPGAVVLPGDADELAECVRAAYRTRCEDRSARRWHRIERRRGSSP